MKTKIITLLAALLLVWGAAQAQDQITFTWTCTAGLSRTFTLDGIGVGENATLNWGDGKTITIDSQINMHIYSTDGSYTVTIKVTNKQAYLSSLIIDNQNLTALNVSGVSKLTNLDCSDNQLSALNISKNTKLTTLYCQNNQLSALDVSQNPNLTILHCYQNKLSALNVNGITPLTELYCDRNQLSALDVSQNPNLIKLQCHTNSLSALKVSGATALTVLNCSSNTLSSLDVGQNPNLTYLDCNTNQISALDVSRNPNLISLNCSSNTLSSLLIKNTNLTTLDCSKNRLSLTALYLIKTSGAPYSTTLSLGGQQLAVSIPVGQAISIPVIAGSNSNINITGGELGSGYTYTNGTLIFFKSNNYTVKMINSKVTNSDKTTADVTITYTVTGNLYLVSTFTWTGSASKKGFSLRASSGTNNVFIDWGNHTGDLCNGKGGSNVTDSVIYGDTKSYTVSVYLINTDSKLTYLALNSSGVSTLDVSKAPDLERLYCHDNNLSALNLSNNKQIDYFECENNHLTLAALYAMMTNGAPYSHSSSISPQTLPAATVAVGSGISIPKIDGTANDIGISGKKSDTDYTYDGKTLIFLTVGNDTVTMTNPLVVDNTTKHNPAQVKIIYTVSSSIVVTFSWTGTGATAQNFYFQASKGSNNVMVDWGNGKAPVYYSGAGSSSVNPTVTYGDTNIHTVTLTVGGDLTYLNLNNTGIMKLDVSEATALTDLRCSSNKLTSLDVSKNTALTTLDCSSNQLDLVELYSVITNGATYSTLSISPQTLPAATVAVGSGISIPKIDGTESGVSISGKTEGTDYTYADGTLTFLKAANYTVTMTNSKVLSGSTPAQVKITYMATAGATVAATANNADWGAIDGAGDYATTTNATLTATPATGCHFVNWTNADGTEVSAANPYSFTVTQDSSLVANFAINQYTVAASANDPAYGTVTGADIYNYGATSTLTATPDDGYSFVNWTNADGTEVSTENPFIFTVTQDSSLVANFAANQYTVAASVNNSAYGTVTGADTYNYGATATLTATPNNGYSFVNWTNADGTEVSTANPYSFTVTQDSSLVANFAANQYTVAASVNNSAYGTVTGADTYNYGATATLTATPNNGYSFVNWTNADGTEVSTANPYTFVVTQDSSLVANFEQQGITTNVNDAIADAASVSVYPNPTTGKLTIENGQLKVGTVELFDMQGKKRSTFNAPLSTLEIDLGSYPQGVYLLRVNGTMHKVVKK